jgi:predicted helicase
MKGIMEKHLEGVKNWSEFTTLAESLSAKGRGDLFELLTKCYLRLDSKYASEFVNIWLWSDIPPKVKDSLNLPSRDMGIDIVAETKTNKYWAVQCKYRSTKERPLTWREAATSVALSFVGNKFEGLLIAHTSEKLAKIFNRAEGKVIPLSLEEWEALDEEFFKRLRLLLQQGHAPLPNKREPYPYQQIAIKKAVEYFGNKNNRRGKLIMPCGAGKSLTAFWIAEALNSKTIIVAVPSLALIQQTLPDWLNEYAARGESNKLRYRCVCSDKTVEDNIDSFVVHVHDLGFPCSTNLEEVREWLRDTKDAPTRVIFTTYQSGKIVADAIRAEGIRVDLGIMDEAHKTVGQKGKAFTHLLFDKNIPIERRLFMTATERRFKGESDEVISMDDASIYGDVFESLSFKNAIENKILSDYKIVTMLVSSKEIEKYVTENSYLYSKDNSSLEGEAHMFAAAVALAKMMKKYGINHPVSFHSSVKKAEKFKAMFAQIYKKIVPELGEVDTFHVSGKTPANERRKELGDFRDEEQALITNARCLTEGVDVKKIDCVLFADPRKSKVDIVQAAGRAMRRLEGKQFGYILVPVISSGEPPHEFVDSKEFEPVLEVVRALATNDERIIDELEAKKKGEKTHTRIMEVEGTDYIAETFNLTDFASSIETKVWQRATPLTRRYLPYEEAIKFVHSLKLKGYADWRAYCVKKYPNLPPMPENIPPAPYQFYGRELFYNTHGGWRAWLGLQLIGEQWWSYDKASEYVRALKLPNTPAWWKWAQSKMRPSYIPYSPYRIYPDFYDRGGWSAWLGTGRKPMKHRKANTRNAERFLPYKEARDFVRALHIARNEDWRVYCTSGNKPANIPSSPELVYGQEYVDGGGRGSWLGTKLWQKRIG